MASATHLTDQMMTGDGQLLADVAATASQEAFAELVRRHGPMVLAVCRRQLGNHADAEDAAQAVFLILWQRARALRRRASVAGWLHHTARNISRNVLKVRKVRDKHERNAAEQNELIEQNKQWNAIKDSLDDEVDHLPEKYRLPIVLFHLEGRSLEEIAVLLHLKESTVGTRLIRGRERLRKSIKRRGIDLAGAGLGTLLSHGAAHAALPLFFAEKTARAASLLAAGRLATGELISAHAVALSKGAMQMQTVAKIKTVAGVVVFLATAVAGVGIVIAQQRAQDELTEQHKPIVPAAIENAAEPNPARPQAPARGPEQPPAKDNTGRKNDKKLFDQAAVVVRVKQIEMQGGESGRTHYYARVAAVIKYDLKQLNIDEKSTIRPPTDSASLKRIYFIVKDIKGEKPLAEGSSAKLYIDRFKDDIWYLLGGTVQTGTRRFTDAEKGAKE